MSAGTDVDSEGVYYISEADLPVWYLVYRSG